MQCFEMLVADDLYNYVTKLISMLLNLILFRVERLGDDFRCSIEQLNKSDSNENPKSMF